MTGTSLSEGGAEAGAAPASSALAQDADRLFSYRGETTISPAVVQKITSKAASEVEGVQGVSSGLRRLTGRTEEDPDAKVKAEVEREHASVDLGISVRYPQPVASTAERVREHVVRRLQQLTGLVVTDVNITVHELVVGDDLPRRPRVI